MPDLNLVEDAFFLARQAITDRNLNLVGYELLYRRNQTATAAEVQDHLQASARVYSLALLDLGVGQLGSGLPITINVPQFWLEQDDLFPTVTSKVVLEILEQVEPSPKVIQSLKKLREKGYIIALDDFVLTESNRVLIQCAQWIKLDTHDYGQEELKERVQQLKAYPVKLVAEKIESWQEFRDLEAMGFDYFQGFFLSRPRVFKGHQAHSSQVVLLELLQQLYREDMNVDLLVDTIVTDPGMTYRLLRHINSAGYMFKKEISSLHQAVVILGQERLRSMVSLLLWSKSPHRSSSQLPSILVRAKSCEELAKFHNLEQVQSCFTVGTLSNLHLALGMEAQEMAEQLKLEPIIAQGLLGKGIPGEILQLAIAYEQGDWDAMEQSPWYRPEVNTCFFDAITWADTVVHEMGKG
ncbi:EAL and HDOD domain-containing protein [Oceanospirillum maris]|uniref:EAL and HDOD domain-containing protein n=1 Tax=Oceanospirillum maris TaxID=64977 RepID=UPI00040E9960|nr:HDOD domain-containing protein [Oceanospirillum maris]